MKKLIYTFCFVLALGCSSATEENETELGIVSPDNEVRIEVTTNEPSDEIFVNYYVYQTDDYNLKLYPFNYDSQGNADPVIITLSNYDFRYIQGETYRNRANISSPLTLKIYLNNELIIEETPIQDANNTNSRITFNYDIVTKKNI